jgi:hypothetical protein
MGLDPATVFQARRCVCQLVAQYLSMIDGRREEQRTELNASFGDYKASDGAAQPCVRADRHGVGKSGNSPDRAPLPNGSRD